jgi:hypothetical protein
MLVIHGKPLRLETAMLVLATPLALTCISACQTAKPAASVAAPVPAMTPYTAPDQTASAKVPAGWKVTSAGQTVIQMAGPNGETVVLGNTITAQNAAFQLGRQPGNGIDLTMPYTATLPQKLTMLLEQGAALARKGAAQFSITSATPIALPAALGQCGRFVGGFTNPQGPRKFIAVSCSLPLDSGGDYKNIMLYADAPAATAAQSAPTAQAIFQSYTMPAAWLQKKLAPYNAAVSSPSQLAQAAAIMRSTNAAAAGADNAANCFDLSVLRQTPTALLPRSCGGTKPD